jgi:hypothetical protein
MVTNEDKPVYRHAADVVESMLRKREDAVIDAGGSHPAFRAQDWYLTPSGSTLEDTESLHELGRRYGCLGSTIEKSLEKEWKHPVGLWFEEYPGSIRNVYDDGHNRIMTEPWLKKDENAAERRRQSTAVRGFDGREIWNLDYALALQIYIRLAEFISSSSEPRDHSDDPSYDDKSKRVLNGLAGFIVYRALDDGMITASRDLVPDGYWKDDQTPLTHDVLENCVNHEYKHVFKWLSKNILELWT